VVIAHVKTSFLRVAWATENSEALMHLGYDAPRVIRGSRRCSAQGLRRLRQSDCDCSVRNSFETARNPTSIRSDKVRTVSTLKTSANSTPTKMWVWQAVGGPSPRGLPYPLDRRRFGRGKARLSLIDPRPKSPRL
jgi:hypothetical protein